MKEAFQFETGDPGDVAVLSGFLRNEYPEGEIADERFLQWEYCEGPFGKALVTLAKDQQQVPASQYAVIPVHIIVEGKKVRGSLSLNTLTVEKFRGMGLFTKSAEVNYSHCQDAGILFTIGVPNKNSFQGFVNKLKFMNPGNLVFLVKPLHPMRILKSFLMREAEKKGVEIQLKINKDGLAQKSISFFDPVTDGDLYDEFWNLCSGKSGIVLDRTKDYMSWRYFKNPLRKYEVFKLVEKGEMKAIIAIRVLHVFGMRTCVVMDFFSTDNLYRDELLREISNLVKVNDLDIMVAVTANRKETYSGFRKSGFITLPKFLLPQQLPFIIRLHKQFENSVLLFDLDNWHFSFGDYDIF